MRLRLLQSSVGYGMPMTGTSPHRQLLHGPSFAAREPEHKRLTRNLHELLQELRVTQTGVQILTGFLLTLPFSSRFPDLTMTQRQVYLAVLAGSVVSTGIILAPVAFHRVLFRRGQRPWIVTHANRAARAGLLALALTTSGAVWLVFDIVTDRVTATLAGGLCIVFFVLLWVVYPLAARHGQPSSPTVHDDVPPDYTSDFEARVVSDQVQHGQGGCPRCDGSPVGATPRSRSSA